MAEWKVNVKTENEVKVIKQTDQGLLYVHLKVDHLDRGSLSDTEKLELDKKPGKEATQEEKREEGGKEW